jgi:hypothetical protein
MMQSRHTSSLTSYVELVKESVKKIAGCSASQYLASSGLNIRQTQWLRNACKTWPKHFVKVNACRLV